MNPKIDMTQMPKVTDAVSAERFIRWCCRAVGPAFHPDTNFKDYVEADGTRTFTEEEAARLDAQMEAVLGQVPDPYAIGLEEFEAIRGGPVSPTTPAVEPGPAEGTTMRMKVLLSRRTDQADPILSAFQAARMQISMREARAIPQLSVIHVPDDDKPHIDTVVISGGLNLVVAWLRHLVSLGVSQDRYVVELPPGTDTGTDWPEWLADHLDEPCVRFDCGPGTRSRWTCPEQRPHRPASRRPSRPA